MFTTESADRETPAGALSVSHRERKLHRCLLTPSSLAATCPTVDFSQLSNLLWHKIYQCWFNFFQHMPTVLYFQVSFTSHFLLDTLLSTQCAHTKVFFGHGLNKVLEPLLQIFVVNINIIAHPHLLLNFQAYFCTICTVTLEIVVHKNNWRSADTHFNLSGTKGHFMVIQITFNVCSKVWFETLACPDDDRLDKYIQKNVL